MSIYADLVAANVPTDNHESDLYVLVCEDSTALVKKHGLAVTMFRSNLDGKLWYDIPFMYEPFWEAVSKRNA